MRKTLVLLGSAGVALAFAPLLGACTPQQEGGQCDVDDDCTGRGQICDAITHSCANEQGDHAKIEEDPPEDFTDKLVPFFRGRVCVPKGGEAQPGTPIPMTFNPCVHPCMDPGAAFYNLQWNCAGSSCSGIALFWNETDGAGCPAEAFAKFDEDQCDYTHSFSGNVAENDPYTFGPVEIDGNNNIEANIALEIPFITTDDLESIDASSESNASDECKLDECAGNPNFEACLKRCKIREKVEQYKQETDRLVLLELRNSYPMPPEWCGDFEAPGPDLSVCTCYDIGFDES